MHVPIIRLADIKDIDRLTEIIKKYREFYGVLPADTLPIRNFIGERIAKSESKIFIAVNEKTNTIVGFVQLYPSFSTVSLKPQWMLNDFYVEKAERKKGVGAMLMNAVVAHFSGKAKGFILVTAKTNEEAKRFYTKHGWKTDVYDFYTYTY